jgi:hypothetical protein
VREVKLKKSSTVLDVVDMLKQEYSDITGLTYSIYHQEILLMNLESTLQELDLGNNALLIFERIEHV